MVENIACSNESQHFKPTVIKIKMNNCQIITAMNGQWVPENQIDLLVVEEATVCPKKKNGESAPCGKCYPH